MTSTPQPRTFAEHVADYALAGWPCILPVPPTTKTPPPTGFTGAEGRDTPTADLVAWAGTHPSFSIALRMPDGIIGIDVDQYVKKGVQKRGAETLAACIERWGPLPATWTSTAREPDGPSRIHFFRVPAQRYATKLTGPTSGDVEVIQRHHRYAVVWPSPHEEHGTYTWYDPQGHASPAPPKPDELAELPASWVAGLAEGATAQGPASADVASGHVLLDQLLEDWRPECADITSARLQALDELHRADAGSRHDTMTARVHHLVQLAAHGHTGVAAAVLALRDAWAELTAGEDRAEEFDRMLVTSARKAVTVVGPVQVTRDPCLLMQGAVAAPPAPGDDRKPDPETGAEADATPDGVEPARWYSVREHIGVHAFDPMAMLDQPLAEAVLERTWPVLRYAYDAGSWLIRAPRTWENRKDLSGWAVAQVAPLMPLGDPTAEKDSDAYARSQRRGRLMSAAGAKAISSKIDALVKGGTHPVSLKLSDLDADPEVLWAGGAPWSLRASTTGPVAAGLDPSSPHLHSAGVAPELRETPLWDAFLAAVWPDPEIRRWAVRVLSICFTGYADRALPILLGETGRGKTQVIHLMMSVLGTYAHAADPRLMGTAENAHASIVYALKGRRLSFIDEGPREGRWAQERLKQLTGGAELTANQMNQNPITFRPTHTLVLTANDEPILTDPAVRSRVRLIPCEGDPELVRETRAAIGHVSSTAWRAEAPGVLALMMAEAGAWLTDPSTALATSAPESIRYLAEHLGAEQDPIGVWLEEETEAFELGTPSRELYQAFTASCLRNNLRRDQIPGETKWARALTRWGYPSLHTRTGKTRQLRVRSGGFMPGMPASGPVTHMQLPEAVQQPTTTSQPALDVVNAPPTDGLGGSVTGCDGLVTGSNTNQSQDFSQVNPPVSVHCDGCDGLFTFPHTCAHTHAQEGPGGDFPEPVTPSVAGELAKPLAKAKREQTAEARQQAVEKRAAARAEKVAAAAGATYALPAVVTRDGAVRSCSVADAGALLETLGDNALTVDVETTGYPVGHQDFAMRTVQLGNEQLSLVLDPAEADQAALIAEHLARAPRLHAHSATADLVPLVAYGLADATSAWERMVDTGILAKLSDPASTGNDADLKNLSKAVLGPHALSPEADKARAALFKAGGWLTDTEVTTATERSGWAQVDSGCETMIRYAASDVLDDAALALRLPDPGPVLLERERTVQRMTSRIAHVGIRIDGDQVARLLGEHRTARDEHAGQVRAFGVDNPGSGPQVAEAFGRLGTHLPATRTGKPSVAAGVLEPWRELEGPVGDLTRAVLDYRHHSTALGLLLEPWNELVVRGDGRARPTVYTLGADTGRMSCVRPNLQQVSREGGLRACFTADPGQLLVSADFAGVELRVAAALSGDQNLAAIMADPERDLHWEIAKVAFGPDATKAQRYRIKRGVFGRIYGGGVGAVAAGVGVTPAVAKQVIDVMDQMTPGLAEWSARMRYQVEAGHLYWQAYSGRTIHLSKKAPHAAPNYCIQGTARELLVDALLRWRETRWGDCVLFPVHDEVVTMIPEAEAQEATEALSACMTSALNGIPIVAEPSTPTYSWSDAA